MSKLPTLGAALRPEELPPHIDWLVDGARDLELQGFHDPDVLVAGDWKPRAAEVRKLLEKPQGPPGHAWPVLGAAGLERSRDARFGARAPGPSSRCV